MRIRLLTLFLIFLFISSGFAQESTTKLVERILDMNDCVRLCQLNSEKLLRAKKDIDIAKQRLSESNAFIYPKLDLNFNYSRYAAADYFALPPSFGSTLLPPFNPASGIENSSNYFSSRVSLYHDLYNAGRFIVARQMGVSELKRTESQYDQIKNETILVTKKTFYELLGTIEKVKDYKFVSELLKQVVDDSVRRNLSNNEQKRLQIESAYLQNKTNFAEYNVTQKKLQLLNVAGLELNTTISVKGDLNPVITDVDLNKCLAWAYRFRPELRQIQVQEDMDKLSVDLAQAQQRPTIVLGMNYVIEGDKFPFPKQDWSATVNLSLPMFEGWAGWSRLEQSKIRAEQGKLKRVEYEDKVNYEVRQSYEKYMFWKKEVEQRSKVLDDTKKLFEDVKTKWTINEIRAVETMDILKLYINILDDYRESVVNLLISQAELETAMGKVFAERQ